MIVVFFGMNINCGCAALTDSLANQGLKSTEKDLLDNFEEVQKFSDGIHALTLQVTKLADGRKLVWGFVHRNDECFFFDSIGELTKILNKFKLEAVK